MKPRQYTGLKSVMRPLTLAQKAVFRGYRMFTTGHISSLLGVAPRTVSKWFDSGWLPGVRLPGSQDRRIPRSGLLEFCRTHKYVDALQLLEGREGPERVLACGLPRLVADRLAEVVSKSPMLVGADLRFTDDLFEIASDLTGNWPEALVVHLALGRAVARRIVRQIEVLQGLVENAFKPPCRVLVLYDVIDGPDPELEGQVPQMPDTADLSQSPIVPPVRQMIPSLYQPPALPAAESA